MKKPFSLLLLCSLAACQSSTDRVDSTSSNPSSTAVVTGTVFYRERIALPADARLLVRVEDVSLMDAPATRLGESVTSTDGKQVPLPFSVSYDTSKLIPQGRYAVSARITDQQGKLMWITDTHTPLPPVGQPVQLRLVQVP